MIKEMTFVAGNKMMKLRVMPDGSIYGSSPKTGLDNFLPHAVVEKGIKEAKDRDMDSEDVEEAEKEVKVDIEWIKNHSQDEICKEVTKEMAKRGLRKVKEIEKDVDNNTDN